MGRQFSRLIHGMVPLVPLLTPSATPTSSTTAGSDGQLTLRSKLICKQPLVSWDSKLAADREVALKKWTAVVLTAPILLEVSWSVMASIAGGYKTGSLKETLKSMLSHKSNAPLQSHVGPLMRYIHRCRQTGRSRFPIDEPLVYEFMLEESAKCAATSLRRFLDQSPLAPTSWG